MIVVTGASRGLGFAICERLRAAGHEVFGLARDTSNLPFESLSCDVSKPESVRQAASELKQHGTTVTGLINAAGIASLNLAVTTPLETAKQIIDTNLLGTIYCCQTISPLMMRTKRGSIINFSTIAVRLALKGESIYVASKAGIEGFSRVFAREMADFGITVNCIAPGPIDTSLLKGVSSEQISKIVAQQIIPKQFEPGAVCDLVEVLLGEQSRSLTGEVLHVGGA
jgi:3-oxoacyl-[acyl-carrier protein] reductase